MSNYIYLSYVVNRCAKISSATTQLSGMLLFAKVGIASKKEKKGKVEQQI